MSHLVSAEEPGDPINARQIEAFAALRQALPAMPRLARQLVGDLPASEPAP